MHGEVTESTIIGGDIIAAQRIIEKHNERARQIRQAEAAKLAGELVSEQMDKNGAGMEPIDENYVPEEKFVPRQYTVDI